MSRLIPSLILAALLAGQSTAQQLPGGVRNSGVSDPAEEYRKLKEMGLSDAQIRALAERKLSSRHDSLYSSEDRLRFVEKDTTGKAAAEAAQPAADSLLIEELRERGPIYGQDVFRNSNVRHYEKARDAVAPEDYVLGPGDEFSVSVWGFTSYNNVFRVEEDGYITSGMTGRLYLKGLTFKEARSVIRGRFAQFLDLRNSEIAVALTYSRVVNVNIVGEVHRPGSYNLPAINSAFMALVAAGGPSRIGSVRNIMVKRAGKTVDTLDVYRFLMDPAAARNIYLQHGDYLFVPVAERTIEVSGEVRRPHTYELRPGEQLSSLIEYAGGFANSAYKANIMLTRVIDNEEKIISIDRDSLLKAGADFPLEGGDKITVSRIPEGYYNYIRALGAVKIPGDYELRPGERISDLLKKTDGVNINAYLQRAYLIRKNEDYTKTYLSVNLGAVMKGTAGEDDVVLQDMDELLVLSKIDFEDDFYVEAFGELRSPGKFVYGDGLTLKDVLFLAGGLRKEAAYNRIEIFRVIDYNNEKNRAVPVKAVVNVVEISGDLSLSAQDADYRLQPFDQVFVRTNPDFEPTQNVVIAGEVLYPGAYALLKKDETISEVIRRAGGLREYAFFDGTTMVRSRDSIGNVFLNLEAAVKRPRSKYNIVLYDGDSVHIPKTLDLIYISGALGNVEHKNISAPYFGKRAGFYIRRFAGGFNADSYRRGTYVIHPSGVARKPLDLLIFKVYPRVVKGSRINVSTKPVRLKKEKEPIDWNQIIESFTVKATGVLTLWLLVDRVAVK